MLSVIRREIFHSPPLKEESISTELNKLKRMNNSLYFVLQLNDMFALHQMSF